MQKNSDEKLNKSCLNEKYQIKLELKFLGCCAQILSFWAAQLVTKSGDPGSHGDDWSRYTQSVLSVQALVSLKVV